MISNKRIFTLKDNICIHVRYEYDKMFESTKKM